MTVITTSTASTATAYSNQRKIDRCQNGVLWTMFWDGTSTTTTSMDFYYSTDNGSTWTKGGEFGFAGTGTTYTPNGSFFIDLDDYAHVAYKDRHDGFIYYRRGTPNAGCTSWTWSAATTVYQTQTFGDYPDVVAHREGTGWAVHVVKSFNNGSTNYALYRPLTVTSAGAITVGTQQTWGPFGVAAHTYPSIDFNHTGDGKTVAGSTPHLYAAWSVGSTGSGKGIRFKKATYSGGTWTWGTEREIDSASFANAGRISSVFDGTRVVIAYADSASTAASKVRERDAADTTTTTRTPTALSGGTVLGVTVAHDGADLYLGAIGDTSDDPAWVKYDRAGDSWGSWTTLGATTAQADSLSAVRVIDGQLDFTATESTGSPYDVTHYAVTFGITATANPANESDSAQSVNRIKRKALGTATETGDAQPVGRVKQRAVGVADEEDSARTIAVAAKGLATVEETDTAQPFTVAKRRTLGTATENSSAASLVGGVLSRVFTPPTFEERMPVTAGRLFSFFAQTMSYAVVRRNGHYQTVRAPSQEETDALVEGVTWFSGGRSYTVDADTALLLEADGLTVTDTFTQEV